MPRGRWKITPHSVAEEAFCVLIRGDKAGRRRFAKRELKKSLAEKGVALLFLQLCLEFDDTPRLARFRKGLLLAVQAVGTASVARSAKIHRVTLYRMLSKDGNPSLGNLIRILGVFGLRLWAVDEEFYARRSRVVRPKDTRSARLLKASTGRRVWTRNRFEPEDW